MIKFITGMTGSGKTYYTRYICKKIDKSIPFVVVSLKQEDINNFDKEVRKISKIAITNENYKNISKLKDKIGVNNIGFYMDFISPENQITFIDELSLIIRNKKNMVLYIDECHNFIGQSNGTCSKNLISLISMARERNIHIILISQRPQDVHKSALNNCKYKVTFNLSEMNAIKSMSKNMEGVTEEEIQNLSQYHFIIQNSFTKETTKNIKI